MVCLCFYSGFRLIDLGDLISGLLGREEGRVEPLIASVLQDGRVDGCVP